MFHLMLIADLINTDLVSIPFEYTSYIRRQVLVNVTEKVGLIKFLFNFFC